MYVRTYAYRQSRDPELRALGICIRPGIPGAGEWGAAYFVEQWALPCTISSVNCECLSLPLAGAPLVASRLPSVLVAQIPWS